MTIANESCVQDVLNYSVVPFYMDLHKFLKSDGGTQIRPPFSVHTKMIKSPCGRKYLMISLAVFGSKTDHLNGAVILSVFVSI